MQQLSFAERFRIWYDYERDCNAKTLAMLESVPQANRASCSTNQAIQASTSSSPIISAVLP